MKGSFSFTVTGCGCRVKAGLEVSYPTLAAIPVKTTEVYVPETARAVGALRLAKVPSPRAPVVVLVPHA